jgi:2-polyprenyl-3-methyl-5-hydroxy-6-metoxy-1,4-benzoquinol methylase
MIEIEREKAIRNKIQNIEYVRTTIFDERFRQDSIDVIMVFNILHLLEGSQVVIQRINELLKP